MVSKKRWAQAVRTSAMAEMVGCGTEHLSPRDDWNMQVAILSITTFRCGCIQRLRDFLNSRGSTALSGGIVSAV